MPTLINVDPRFIEMAPHLVVVEQIIQAPARAIWPVLADVGSWSDWYDDMSRSDVTGPATEGIGAARTVKVGVLVADERFVLWSPGEALAFE